MFITKKAIPRRTFLSGAGAALALGNALPVWGGQGTPRMPQRALGRTGVQVPILGLGTVALGNLKAPRASEDNR